MDFNFWIEVFTKPKETFERENKNSNFGKGVNNYAIALAFSGFIGALAILLFPSVFTQETSKLYGFDYGALNLVVFPIISVIAGLIYSGIGNGILHIIALLLGGKGTFKQFYYLFSLYMTPIVVIESVFSVIGRLVPALGAVLFFVILIMAVYSLYLLTLSLKEVHGFSTLRAVLVWLIPVILLLGLLFIVFGFVVFAMLGALSAKTSAGTATLMLLQ